MDFEKSGKSARLMAGASVIALMSPVAVSAAEWDLEFGGTYNAWIGYADADSPNGDFDGIEGTSNAEIFFRPTITLDNGIKIGADIELEGFASTTTETEAELDEAYLFVRGSFGDILLGRDQTVQERFRNEMPSAAIISLNSPSTSNFLPFSGEYNWAYTGNDFRRGTLGSTAPSLSGRDNPVRITYFTPRFSGFQLGVSYAPEDTNTSNERDKVFDIGVRYAEEFGGIRFSATANYGTADERGPGVSDSETFGAGVDIGFGGVTIGGSFAEVRGTDWGIADGEAHQLGISYETGPWVFSGSYFYGWNYDNEHLGFGPRESFESVTLAGSYKLAKGVRLNLFGAYVNFDEQVSDAGFGTNGDDIDGFVIGTGIGLSW